MTEQFVMETLPLLPDERCVPDVPQGLGLLPMPEGKSLAQAAADAMQSDEATRSMRLGAMTDRVLRREDEPVWRGALALALLADTWQEPIVLRVYPLNGDGSTFVRSALFACDCSVLHLAVLEAEGRELVLGLTHSGNVLTLPATGEDWRGVLPGRLTWINPETGRLTDPCGVLCQRDRHVLCARLEAMDGSEAVKRYIADLRAVDEQAMTNALSEANEDWVTAIKALTGLSQERGFEALEAERCANVNPGESPVLAALGITGLVMQDDPEQRTYLWQGQPFARTNVQLGLEPVPGAALHSLAEACTLLEQYSRRYDREAAARLGVWLQTAGMTLADDVRAKLLDEQIALQQRSAEAPEPVVLTWPWSMDTPALQLLLTEFLGEADAAPVLTPFADRLALLPDAVLGDPVLDAVCAVDLDERHWKVLPPLSAVMAAHLTVRPQLRASTLNSLRVNVLDEAIEAELLISGQGGQVLLRRAYPMAEVLRFAPEQTPEIALWPSVPVDPARWKRWYLSLRGDVTVSLWQAGSWVRMNDLPEANEEAEQQAEAAAEAAVAEETTVNEAAGEQPAGTEQAAKAAETADEVTIEAEPDDQPIADTPNAAEAAPDETDDTPAGAAEEVQPERRFGSNRSLRRFGMKPKEDVVVLHIEDTAEEEEPLPVEAEQTAEEEQSARPLPGCRVYETDAMPALVALHQQDACLGVLCYQADTYQPVMLGEAVAALDLGASGTSIAMRLGAQAAQAVFVPSLWHVMLRGSWEDLPGEHLPVWPLGPVLPSSVLLFDEEGDEPFLHGMICPEEATECCLQRGQVPCSELLWRTDEEARRALRLLLRQTMLTASFHAVMNGAQSISWRVNLVQTMAQSGRKRLLDEVRAAANWCERTTGLLQSPGSMAQQVKENLSIAAYLREFGIMRGAYVLLNVGGSDAALTLWLRGMNKPAAEALLHLGVNSQLMSSLTDQFNYLVPDFGGALLPEEQLTIDLGHDMTAWSQRRSLLDDLLGPRLPQTSALMNDRFWQGRGTYTQALLLFGFAQLFTLAGSLLEQANRNTLMNDYLPPELAICLCGRGSKVFAGFDPAVQQALQGFARMAMAPEHPVRSINLVLSPQPKLEAALGLAQLQSLPEPAAAAIGDISESRDVLYLTAQFLGTFAMQFPQSASLLVPGLLESDGMFSEEAEERLRNAAYQSRGSLQERFAACVEQIRSLYAADNPACRAADGKM